MNGRALILIGFFLIIIPAAGADPYMVWKGQIDGIVSQLDVSSSGGCISATSGETLHVVCNRKRWSTDFESRIVALSLSDDERFILVATADQNLHLLNTGGELIWKKEIDGTIKDTSVANFGSALSVVADDKVILLDSRGKVKWKQTLPMDALSVDVSGSGGSVIVAGKRNVQYFEGGGEQRWEYEHTKDIRSIDLSGDGGFISVGGKNYVLLLDGEGNLRWEKNVEGRVLSVGVTNDGAVIGSAINPPDTDIIYLDNQGKMLWEYKPLILPDIVSFSESSGFILLGRFSDIQIFQNKNYAPAASNEGFGDLPPVGADLNAPSSGGSIKIPQSAIYLLLVAALIIFGLVISRHKTRPGERAAFTSDFSFEPAVLSKKKKDKAPEEPFLVYRTISKRFIKQGDKTIVEVKLKRHSDEIARSVSFREKIPSGLKVLTGKTSWEGEIRGNDFKAVEYILHGAAAANYVLEPIKVRYIDQDGKEQIVESTYDEIIVESPEVELEIKKEQEKNIKEAKVSVIEQQCIKLWDHKLGDEVWGADVPVHGNYCVVGSWDHNVYMFDKDGALQWKKDVGERVTSVACISYLFEDYIAAGCWDGSLILLNRSGDVLWKKQVEGAIFGICISDEAEYVVAGSNDRKAYMFDIRGNKLWDFQAGECVNNVSTSRDGSYVGIASNDKKMYLVDRDGKLLWEYETEGLVFDVEVSSEAEYVVVGSYDHHVSALGKDGTLLWKKPTVGNVRNIPISLKGNYVAVGAGDGKIFFYDLKGEILFIYKTVDKVRSLSVSSQGNYIVIATTDNSLEYYTYPLDLMGDGSV